MAARPRKNYSLDVGPQEKPHLQVRLISQKHPGRGQVKVYYSQEKPYECVDDIIRNWA